VGWLGRPDDCLERRQRVEIAFAPRKDFAVTQADDLPPFGAAMFHPAVNRRSATPNKQE
jgi:hypothetical protein